MLDCIFTVSKNKNIEILFLSKASYFQIQNKIIHVNNLFTIICHSTLIQTSCPGQRKQIEIKIIQLFHMINLLWHGVF